MAEIRTEDTGRDGCVPSQVPRESVLRGPGRREPTEPPGTGPPSPALRVPRAPRTLSSCTAAPGGVLSASHQRRGALGQASGTLGLQPFYAKRQGGPTHCLPHSPTALLLPDSVLFYNQRIISAEPSAVRIRRGGALAVSLRVCGPCVPESAYGSSWKPASVCGEGPLSGPAHGVAVAAPCRPRRWATPRALREG